MKIEEEEEEVEGGAELFDGDVKKQKEKASTFF